MPRRRGKLDPWVALFVIIPLVACPPPERQPPPDPLEVGEDISPDSLPAACQGQEFAVTSAESTLATGARVRIRPHAAALTTTLPQLLRGRFVAKLENLSDSAHPNWALKPRGQSCWRIVSRGRLLTAEYVALDSLGWVVPDTTLVIEFHAKEHDSLRAMFRRTNPLWSWVTCTSNGCCRSSEE